MIVIGLTGGIASGKSTISGFLADFGAAVIDADKVGHELLQNDPGIKEELVREFGEGILSEDKAINRAKLANIVFNDSIALDKLNRIMHPIMYKNIENRIIKLHQDGAKVVVIEAAVLIEAKWNKLVDEIWVAVIPEDVAVDRVVKRSGFKPEEVRARIRSQMSNEERCREADVIIDTNCTIEEEQVLLQKLWKDLLIRERKKRYQDERRNNH